jgi:hypothetical protein
MANAHYTELVHARDILVGSTATLRTYSELTGRMFIEQQCLNKEQASAVRDRLVNEVALLDNIGWSNAWNYYNSVATALRMSHPKNWFEDQAACHSLITSHFVTTENVQDIVQDSVQDSVQEPDNQLSIFDVIPDTRLDEPTSVVAEEFPQEFYAPSINDLPLDVQEEIYVDDLLQEKTLSGEVNPDEDFFNFGDAQLPTFDLPDL